MCSLRGRVAYAIQPLEGSSESDISTVKMTALEVVLCLVHICKLSSYFVPTSCLCCCKAVNNMFISVNKDDLACLFNCPVDESGA